MFKVDTCCHLDISWFVWIRVWNVSCWKTDSSVNITLLFSFFSVRLLSVIRGHSVFFFILATTVNEGFSIPDFIHYIYFPILTLWQEPVFPCLMFSAKQGNYWYHFIASLVCRGPWLGIETGTSRTLSQYSTTRLSRRRLYNVTETYVIGFANLSSIFNLTFKKHIFGLVWIPDNCSSLEIIKRTLQASIIPNEIYYKKFWSKKRLYLSRWSQGDYRLRHQSSLRESMTGSNQLF